MAVEQEKAQPYALAQMNAIYPHARWAAYQNVALDSSNCGHLQFLAIGPENTYKEPPVQYPVDNEHGMGWRYRFAGWVDLETGEIKKEKLEGPALMNRAEKEVDAAIKAGLMTTEEGQKMMGDVAKEIKEKE